MACSVSFPNAMSSFLIYIIFHSLDLYMNPKHKKLSQIFAIFTSLKWQNEILVVRYKYFNRLNLGQERKFTTDINMHSKSMTNPLLLRVGNKK